LTVHYTGWLQDTTKPDNKGTQFDTSVGKNPFSFFLGFSQVIAGWDLGIPGMRVGGKRLLIIPPGLAYGSQGSGPIPGNSTLIFEVELVNVQ
jgi:FKBP-type peptidyl-prolyl cis-trans isomerase FkpA